MLLAAARAAGSNSPAAVLSASACSWSVDEHSGFGRNELRRAADAGRDDVAGGGERFEGRLAERLGEARLAKDVRVGEVARHRVVWHVAGHGHARPAFESRAQRAISDERERAVTEAAECIGEPDDVLALDQRADTDERRTVVLAARERGEALQIDAAIDHLALAARLGHRLLEARSQPVGDPRSLSRRRGRRDG